jgi:hypothetical protein
MGVYRVSYLIKDSSDPRFTTKMSEMIREVDSSEAAVADVKTRHPTDLVRIYSVAMLK